MEATQSFVLTDIFVLSVLRILLLVWPRRKAKANVSSRKCRTRPWSKVLCVLCVQVRSKGGIASADPWVGCSGGILSSSFTLTRARQLTCVTACVRACRTPIPVCHPHTCTVHPVWELVLLTALRPAGVPHQASTRHCATTRTGPMRTLPAAASACTSVCATHRTILSCQRITKVRAAAMHQPVEAAAFPRPFTETPELHALCPNPCQQIVALEKKKPAVLVISSPL